MKKISLDEKVLSLALNDKKYAMELSNSINSKYFVHDFQWLYDVIMHYFEDPNIKEIPTINMIKEYLGDNYENRLEAFNNVKQLDIEPTEFNWLLNKLRLRYNNKLQGNVRDTIAQILKEETASPERVEEINKVLKEAIVNIDSINRKAVYKEGTLRDSAEDRTKRYSYIKEHPETARGILTGFSTFDTITNGLHPGEFIIVAGDTGTGKSILLHNIAVNAYMKNNDPFAPVENWDDGGKNILYFSLEMPKSTQERRIDACITNVYSNHIRDGLLPEEDECRYFDGLRFQEKYSKEFHIVDMPRDVTTREIELKYLEVCDAGFKPDLIVIDYMGIMTPVDSVGIDWQDLGTISAELHEFARVYEITVLTASQVNKTKDGQERYSTDRISRSGIIPTNADIIMQIANRPDEDIRTDMVVHITKMRDGAKGHFILSKDFGKMKVIDIADDTFIDEDDDDDDF